MVTETVVEQVVQALARGEAVAAAGHEGLTPRTKSALLCSIMRRGLLDALHGHSLRGGRLVVGPDEVMRELPSLRAGGVAGHE